MFLHCHGEKSRGGGVGTLSAFCMRSGYVRCGKRAHCCKRLIASDGQGDEGKQMNKSTVETKESEGRRGE